MFSYYQSLKNKKNENILSFRPQYAGKFSICPFVSEMAEIKGLDSYCRFELKNKFCCVILMTFC